MAEGGPGIANSAAVPASRWVLFWTIALGGAAFDLATKTWVFHSVGQPGSPSVELIPRVLELRTSYNQGALWGWGRNLPHSSLLFAALSAVAAVAIVWFLFVGRAARDAYLTAALALITAGAMGNCFDRVVHGKVRDFVHFHVDAINFDFAIFNFADNMLVLGAAALLLLQLRPDPVAAVEAVAPTESGVDNAAIRQADHVP